MRFERVVGRVPGPVPSEIIGIGAATLLKAGEPALAWISLQQSPSSIFPFGTCTVSVTR